MPKTKAPAKRKSRRTAARSKARRKRTPISRTDRLLQDFAPEAWMNVAILPQPNDTTCGPTCLHAVYRYYGDQIQLSKVIREVPSLAGGGTLAVFLACHALRRGYRARIYTYNMQIFDPTWFRPGGPPIAERLREQMAVKDDAKIQLATLGYLEFLSLGGELRFEDMRPSLFLPYLSKGLPILTGLSATYLYGTTREYGPTNEPDDIRGEPAGHFVVLSGYNRRTGAALVADPYLTNPAFGDQYYEVAMERLMSSILLGIVTYDANLLIIEPELKKGPKR